MARVSLRRFAALAVALGTVLGRPAPSLADEPARFVWVAPAECPSRESVLARARFIANDSEVDGVRFGARVRVEASEGRWVAHVATRGAAALPERVLEARSCSAIADAVALIVGLSAAPAAFRAEAPLVPVRSVPAAPPPEDRPTASGRIPGALLASVAAAGNFGSVPSATPGVALGLAWRTGRAELALEGAAYVAQRGYAPGSAGLGASLALAAASLDVCLPVPIGDRLVMAPCAGVTVERIAADGFGDAAAFRSSRAVVSSVDPMAELAVEWWATSSVALRGAARALVSLARPAFVIQQAPGGAAPPASVFREDAAAFESRFTLVVRLTK